MVETLKMSSKGQIVIPQQIREKINAGEGTLFAVLQEKDNILLRKIATPSKEDLIQDLKVIASEGKKRLTALGIKEKDIPKIVQKSRK